MVGRRQHYRDCQLVSTCEWLVKDDIIKTVSWLFSFLNSDDGTPKTKGNGKPFPTKMINNSYMTGMIVDWLSYYCKADEILLVYHLNIKNLILNKKLPDSNLSEFL